MTFPLFWNIMHAMNSIMYSCDSSANMTPPPRIGKKKQSRNPHIFAHKLISRNVTSCTTSTSAVTERRLQGAEIRRYNWILLRILKYKDIKTAPPGTGGSVYGPRDFNNNKILLWIFIIKVAWSFQGAFFHFEDSLLVSGTLQLIEVTFWNWACLPHPDIQFTFKE